MARWLRMNAHGTLLKKKWGALRWNVVWWPLLPSLGHVREVMPTLYMPRRQAGHVGCRVVLPKKGILRLAVPRNAMCILAVFAKQIIGMVSCRMLVVLPSKSAKHMAAAPQKRFPGYTTWQCCCMKGTFSEEFGLLKSVNWRRRSRKEKIGGVVGGKALTNGCSVTKTALGSFEIFLSRHGLVVFQAALPVVMARFWPLNRGVRHSASG